MDAAEFMRVFEATKDGLHGLFRKQVKVESEVEDLVQECFLRLWEKRECVTDPASYVFGIAFNLARDFHRKKIRAAIERLEAVAGAEAHPGMQDGFSPDLHYQLKETTGIVREAINGLSPEKKAAFLMIKEQERSYKEAAELSGVPVSTLEKRVAGSLRILRKALTMFLMSMWL